MLTYPDINPIAFEIVGFAVRWYGLMYLLGFLFVYGYCMYQRQQTEPPFTKEAVADLLFYAALGVIFGGTIGYWLIYEPEKLLQDPLLLLKFWVPGRAFHGGLLGVIIAVYFYCRQHQRQFLAVMDYMAPAVPIGLGLGRLGNFLNAELWGRVTSVPWAFVFPGSDYRPRHPSQLYEFLLEGIVLFIILFTFSRKKRPIGQISGLFAFFYGLFRFIVEFYREPSNTKSFLLEDWITMGQCLSIVMMMIGVFVFFYAKIFEQQNGRDKTCNNI